MPHGGKAFQWDRRRRRSRVSKCPCPCVQLCSFMWRCNRTKTSRVLTATCSRACARRWPVPCRISCSLYTAVRRELFICHLFHLKHDTAEAPNYPELVHAPPKRVPFTTGQSRPASKIEREAVPLPLRSFSSRAQGRQGRWEPRISTNTRSDSDKQILDLENKKEILHIK